MKAAPLPPLPRVSAEERRHCDQLHKKSEAQLERLRTVNPVLEALLQGADGVWAGFTKEAATIGHASSAELLANLARINNPHVANTYRLKELLPIAHRNPVIRGRLRQELGLSARSISNHLLNTMRRLMRRDLRAGIRLDYDDPGQLRDLYERARALLEAKAPARASKRKAS